MQGQIKECRWKGIRGEIGVCVSRWDTGRRMGVKRGWEKGTGLYVDQLPRIGVNVHTVDLTFISKM